MTDYAERIEAGSIRFRRRLPGPIERVWAYLTESEKRGRWLAAGEMEPRVGGRLELHFEHATLSPDPDEAPSEPYANTPERISFEGVVLERDPPHRLAHTWQGKDEDSRVLFELEEVGEEVQVTITHTKLRTEADEIGVSGGWHTHLEILADVLQERRPTPFWRRFNVLDAEYRSRREA